MADWRSLIDSSHIPRYPFVGTVLRIAERRRAMTDEAALDGTAVERVMVNLVTPIRQFVETAFAARQAFTEACPRLWSVQASSSFPAERSFVA
jgi:hypothetical protein